MTTIDTTETDPRTESYTVVTDLTDGTYLTAEAAELAEEILSEQGWDVTFRSPRGGEAEGTYRHDDHGLQILGYTIPMPEGLSRAIDDAAAKALGV